MAIPWKRILETAEHVDFIWTWGGRLLLVTGAGTFIIAILKSLGTWWAVTCGLLLGSFLLMSIGAVTKWGRKRMAESMQDSPPPQPPDTRSIEPMPQLRPLVRPTRYGRSADGAGLFVKNDGEPAFDVSIPGTIQIGQSKMSSWNELPSLDKAHGEKLFDVQIELGNGTGTYGTALRDELIRADLESVEVPVRYKDFNNQWYVTICNLERHFQHGIYPRFVRQELAAPPLESKPLEVDVTDPRIYVEPGNDEFIPRGQLPFFVSNRGGSIAHNIEFEPIAVGAKTIHFDKIAQLDRDKPKEALPSVEPGSPIFRGDVASALNEGWNAKGELAEKFQFSLTVNYTDFTETRKFQSIVHMTYLPFVEGFARREAFSRQKTVSEIVRVDRTEFKRLS